jgi:GT2 family glycosyltransferase
MSKDRQRLALRPSDDPRALDVMHRPWLCEPVSREATLHEVEVQLRRLLSSRALWRDHGASSTAGRERWDNGAFCQPQALVLRFPVVVHVDVGIVTFNSLDVTRDALQRLVALEGHRIRLLVHDNASTDGTVDAIAAAVPTADIVRGDRNIGFAAAMNRLFARSTSSWFLALNPDAWPEPGALDALLEAAERHPRAAIVAPRVERPDGGLDHSTLPFPSLRVAAVTAVGGYRWLWPRVGRRLLLPGAWHHDRPREVDWAIGAALLMRRAAIDDVGGFDEAFFMYAEDLDWCWRARQRGWEVWFEPQALVRHVGNASGAAVYGRSRTLAFMANTYRFYRRHHGRLSTSAYRALNAMGSARLWSLARVRGDGGARELWADHVRAALAPAAGGLDRPPLSDAPSATIS